MNIYGLGHKNIGGFVLQCTRYMVQLNLNFTLVYACTLPHVKLQNLECTCTVAHDFGVCTCTSEYMQYTRDACLMLTLDLLHYTCASGVQVQ